MRHQRTGWMILFLACLIVSGQPADAETTWYGYRGEPEYRNLFYRDPSPDSMLLPINVNNHWGLADQLGYVIALPRFEWTDYGYDGLARAMLDGKTGFIVGDGDWHIDPVFDWVDRFEDNVAVVRHRGRYGFIDKRGQVAIEPRYEGMLRFREDVAAAMEQGKVGFLNKAGDWTIEPTFAVARSFHEGFAAVQFSDERGQPAHWGFIDRRGKAIWEDTEGRITELRDFNDGLAAFQVRGEDGQPTWGYLNKRFDVSIEPQYRRARDFTNNLAAVSVPQKGWGFINRSGDWELEPEFDDADDFDTRLAMIRHNGMYGYIDRQGRTGIYPQFKEAEPFQFGLARVSRDNSFAYIGPAGSVRWDPLLRERPGTLERGLANDREVGRGLIDKTAGGQIKRTVRSGGRNLTYDRLQYPRYQGQAPIPYEPEHLYEERLPSIARAGLLRPPTIDDSDKDEDPDQEDGRLIEEVEQPDVVIELGQETPNDP